MKDCCRKKENLEEIQKDKNKLVLQCKECGCKHYEMVADTGKLGVTLKGM